MNRIISCVMFLAGIFLLLEPSISNTSNNIEIYIRPSYYYFYNLPNSIYAGVLGVDTYNHSIGSYVFRIDVCGDYEIYIREEGNFLNNGIVLKADISNEARSIPGEDTVTVDTTDKLIYSGSLSCEGYSDEAKVLNLYLDVYPNATRGPISTMIYLTMVY